MLIYGLFAEPPNYIPASSWKDGTTQISSVTPVFLSSASSNTNAICVICSHQGLPLKPLSWALDLDWSGLDWLIIHPGGRNMARVLFYFFILIRVLYTLLFSQRSRNVISLFQIQLELPVLGSIDRNTLLCTLPLCPKSVGAQPASRRQHYGLA